MIHCTIQRLKSLSWWDAIYLIWSYCSTVWKPIDIKTLAEFTTTNTTITLSTKTYHGSVQFSVNSAKCLHFWQPIWAQSNSLMPVRTIEIISPQSVESNSILKSKWNHSLCGRGWLNPPGVFGADYGSQWMGPGKQSLLIPTWKRILIYSSFLKSVSKYKGPKSLLLMNL